MKKEEHDLLDVSRDDIVPYFMWDYQYTVGEIKKMLAEGDENQRLWLIAKIMRDARYSDVWKFISLQDFLKYRERLMRGRLGLQKDFWQFMYSRWIQHGIVKDDNNSKLTSDEPDVSLFQRSHEIYFETTPVYKANEAHLDREKIQEYFKRVHEYDIPLEDEAAYKALLQNSGVLTLEDIVTVVGLVMFGKRNSGLVPPVHYTQKFLPQSGAVYAHYSGNEITDKLLDSVHFEGTAPDLVERISEKVLLRLATPSKIEGLKREEKIPLPRKVLREALVNAVTHRDYSLQSKIRVFQFDNRLEVISPGGLPNSVTVEKMKVSYSIHRNPLIVKFIENLRYLDGLGRGVPMIFREMKRLNTPIPEIIVDESQVKLVIYFAPTV